MDQGAILKELGGRLFASVATDEVGRIVTSAQAAASGQDRGLRISLHLSGAPELMRFPWELMYQQPKFFSQSERTPVVRSLDIGTASRPEPIQLPMRILGIISNPTGYPELDSAKERRKLEKALKPLTQAGVVDISWLRTPTLGGLGKRISEPDDIHVIHYIGHGAYDESTEAGTLVLETEQGRARDVSGEQLGEMLQDERSLRLVVLNSCEGARTSYVDPFSGVATALLHIDVPAVIAMQFEISDVAAVAFSESLYTSLANGRSIAAAVAPARRAIIGAERRTEFATPVLYLRNGEARLFDIIPSAAVPRDSAVTREESAERSASPAQEVPRTSRPGAQADLISSPVAEQPATNALKVWSGSVEYFKYSSAKSLTRVTLRLDQDHQIELRADWGVDDLVVDGRRISGVKGITEFSLVDGDTRRTCRMQLKYMPGSTGGLRRITTLSVDDSELTLDQHPTVDPRTVDVATSDTDGAIQHADAHANERALPEQWRGDVAYIQTSTTAGVAIVKFALLDEHQLVCESGIFTNKLTIDGATIPPKLMNTVSFSLTDDGETVPCTVRIRFGGDWPSGVPRVDLLSAAGRPVLLAHGEVFHS
nr:CHAT domain-containing protein [Microbacterium yannicii]